MGDRGGGDAGALDVAALEEERDFLLRSLDDLEVERESGAIDEVSYRELHDDYTARAAAVIRALRDQVDARPVAAGTGIPRRRRVVVVSVVLVFALVSGAVLASALGSRLPGETASGNSQGRDAAAGRLERLIRDLEAEVDANPDDYDARLALARAYERNGELLAALQQSDQAITVDPTRPEAHANAGRLLYVASESIRDRDTQAQFVAQASAAFNAAIERDPDYADAYYFRAVLEAATGQLPRAQADLQTYIVKAPDGTYAARARDLLGRVTTAIESPSTTVPSSP